MPVVTKLHRAARRADQVHVHLDGAYAFTAPLDIAAGLAVGRSLSDDEAAALRSTAADRLALDRSLSFLAARPRSVSEVQRHLSTKGFAAPAIEAAVRRLRELALLDDHAFARWWVDNRSRFRPRGALALRQELARHGVSSAIVTESLEGLDESALAASSIAGQAPRLERVPLAAARQRLVSHLQRRGFAAPVVLEVVDAWCREREPASPDAADEDPATC